MSSLDAGEVGGESIAVGAATSLEIRWFGGGLKFWYLWEKGKFCNFKDLVNNRINANKM